MKAQHELEEVVAGGRRRGHKIGGKSLVGEPKLHRSEDVTRDRRRAHHAPSVDATRSSSLVQRRRCSPVGGRHRHSWVMVCNRRSGMAVRRRRSPASGARLPLTRLPWECRILGAPGSPLARPTRSPDAAHPSVAEPPHRASEYGNRRRDYGSRNHRCLNLSLGGPSLCHALGNRGCHTCLGGHRAARTLEGATVIRGLWRAAAAREWQCDTACLRSDVAACPPASRVSAPGSPGVTTACAPWGPTPLALQLGAAPTAPLNLGTAATTLDRGTAAATAALGVRRRVLSDNRCCRTRLGGHRRSCIRAGRQKLSPSSGAYFIDTQNWSGSTEWHVWSGL